MSPSVSAPRRTTRLSNKEMNDASLLPDAVNSVHGAENNAAFQVWCHLADAEAEAKDNSPYPIQSELSMANYKSLDGFYSHLCASLKALQGPAPIVSPRPWLHGCSGGDFNTRFSWFWSAFSHQAAIFFVLKAMLIRTEMGRWFPPAVSIGCEWCERISLSRGAGRNVSYGVNLLKTPCLQEMRCLIVIVLFSFFFLLPPLPKLQDRAMPVKSLLKDVRSSNECNKAPAEATALTRPVLRDVRHRYVKLTSHQ